MTRIGASLLLIFGVAYLGSDLGLIERGSRGLLSAHLFTIAIAILLIATAGTKRFMRQWRVTVLAGAVGILVSTAITSAISGYYAPLYIAATFMMMAAAALLPWGGQWQLALTLACASAMVVGTLSRKADPHAVQHWVTFIVAAGIAHLTVTVEERYRRELRRGSLLLQDRVEALRQNEARLQAEVAERQEAERRAQRGEEKFRRVVETSLDAIGIARFDDGRFLDVNTEACRVSGYTREELIGFSARELGLWADEKQLRACLNELWAHGFVRNMEIMVRQRDIQPKPYLFNAVVVELDGEKCIVCVTRDISALKRNEAELVAAREELNAQVAALQQNEARLQAEVAERQEAERRAQRGEEKFRRVVETSLDPIAIYRLDDGHFLDVNTELCRVSGYTREELLGFAPRELGIWADERQLHQCMNELRAHGFVRNMEIMVRQRYVEPKPYLFNAVVVELNGEKCIVGVSRDITALKRTEAELVAAREAALAASAAKSEFLAMMSHELRTPMNAVLGMTELLSETLLSAEQRRYVDAMCVNGNALIDLISGILDLAKVESGRLSLETHTFDLGDLIEKVLEMLAIRAHEKKLELAARTRADVPPILLGDSLRLRQILVNLIGNAIKFTERGEVVLTVETLADPRAESQPGQLHSAACRRWLRFSVSDTGIGIATAQLDTIFSSFTQADSSLARRYGGSGLGLAISKRLAGLMGGELSVKSSSGKGSTFTFAVPFEVPSTAAGAPEAHPPELPQLRARRILIVDDTTVNRLILREWLEGWGAEVGEAADGEQALAQLLPARGERKVYDAVLLDCRLPTIDGLTVVRRLRAESTGTYETLPHIIPMITADDFHATLVQLGDLDIGDHPRYLLKPVRKTELRRVIIDAKGWETAANGSPPPARAASETDIHATVHDTNSVDTQQEIAHPRVAQRPLRILLAEDSCDNRMLVEAYLKKLNYTVDFAENGAIAIERVKAKAYDLVLMDVQMPVLDGYSAVRAIRQWEGAQRREALPIIALTAAALDEAVRESFAAGCDAHVSKPVRKATLIEAIRNVIDARPAKTRTPDGRGANASGA